MTALDQVGRRAVASPEQIGQVTAVEQARAVAEVAAAVQVAQQFPRDMDAVKVEVVAACRTLSLARKAFYAVQNRGEGKSVHLARELARAFGNFQSGVHELRRDDARGESEIQAFAWDVQTNNRSTRTFVSPHQRMKSGARVPLVDLQDVYLSNQNVGARAMRECIFAALPNWLVDLAEDTCRATLNAGDGRPLDERKRNAVAHFDRLGVRVAQLEARLRRPVAQWDGESLATLEVVFRSLQNGETTVEEQFEPVRVTAAEIIHRSSPAGDAMTDDQRRKLFALLGEAGIKDDGVRHQFATDQLGREVTTYTDLTTGEADLLIAFLEAEARREPPPSPPVDISEPPEPAGWGS